MHTTNVTVLVTRTSLGPEFQNWGLIRKVKDADLVIANTVYDDNDVNSVCQILNISDKPRRLRKGFEIGWAEPIDIVELKEETVSELISENSKSDEAPPDLRCIKDDDDQELSDHDSENSDQTLNSSTTGSINTETGPTDFIQDMIQKIDLDLTDEQKQDIERL